MNSLYLDFYLAIKKNILPLFLICASILILIVVFFPQLSSAQELSSKISNERTILDSYKKSVQTIDSFDESALTADLLTAQEALPFAKQILQIYNTLSKTSSQSDVSISNFAIKVGDVYTATPQKDSSKTTQAAPSLIIKLTVEGKTNDSLIKFSESLYKAFPLAEVKQIISNGNSGAFDIEFFYKPVDATKLASQENVTPLTFEEENSLRTVRQWK